MTKVLAFLKNESGATAIDYGLIAAGISFVIIASANSLGTTLNGTFSTETAYSTEPSTAESMTWPAVRTTNMSPSP